MGRGKKFILGSVLLLTALCFIHISVVSAQPIPFPNVTLGIGETEEPAKVSVLLQILFLLTILSLAPAILIMLTSFTRIVVVLSFLRQAMGTQHMPPNQIII
ncbi:MAG: flagellar biosynthetic protein FliP, partial [Thermodesulfobacteriota bacterium]|nr:flagellar biosynthetic protein FliP [Thermodesulfobacteriota bacterium]